MRITTIGHAEQTIENENVKHGSTSTAAKNIEKRNKISKIVASVTHVTMTLGSSHPTPDVDLEKLITY